MVGATVDIGTGLTVVFSTSGFTAEILDFDWGGITRESFDTSHMGTAAAGVGKFGNMTAIPGDLSDPGELSWELHFNPETEPPIDQPAEVITVTWPKAAADASAATWAASGFCTSYAPGAPYNGKMTGTITIKLSGEVTMVGAAA